MTSAGPPPIETVWNDDDPNVDYSRFGIQKGAGGGGVSSLWAMPAYQSTAVSTLGVLNTYSSGAPCAAAAGSCREVPDVSADADPRYPYLDYWNGNSNTARSESGWQGTGGTSGAAPVWAALLALADANRACRGTLVGLANPKLYELAGQDASTYFNDITVGNNDFTPDGNNSGLYPATVGYDMASGLGTPRAAALAPALCRQAIHIGFPGAVYSFYEQSVHTRLTAALASGQSGPIEFHASRLPEGLHINRNTGVISGRARQPGLRDVTIAASTPSGAYGAVRFTWSVERRPQVSAGAPATSAQPSFSLTLRSGLYEPGLREVRITLPGGFAATSLPRVVHVLSGAGDSLSHRIRLRGQVLTIDLTPTRSPVQIVFAAGGLRARGVPGTRGALAGVVSVTVVDRLGGSLTVRRRLRTG